MHRRADTAKGRLPTPPLKGSEAVHRRADTAKGRLTTGPPLTSTTLYAPRWHCIEDGAVVDLKADFDLLPILVPPPPFQLSIKDRAFDAGFAASPPWAADVPSDTLPLWFSWVMGFLHRAPHDEL